MRDRFPLVVAAAIAFLVGVGWLFSEAGRRGTFAEPMSAYRSAPDGARALYLLGQRLGLPVVRRHMDLNELSTGKTGALVLLGVPRLAKEELDKLQAFVTDGGALLLLLGPEKKERGLFGELLKGDQSVLSAFSVTVTECDTPLLERALEVGVPSPFTRGVEAPLSRVAGYVTRTGSEPMLPLLLDPHADDRAVAATFRHGAGRVVVVSAPDLASNRGLGRGDNARLWASVLGALAANGPVEFDEYHHGFTGERSISGYAAQHGLHWALAQLVFALWLWVAAQRRFGRARLADLDERVASADYLLAMARIYRQGGHRGHAVRGLLDGLVRALSRKAGLGPRATVGEVVRGLNRHGRPDLATALSQAESRSAGASGSDEDVLAFARTCASARRLADHRGESPARRWFRLSTVRAALGKKGAAHPERSNR